MDDEHSRQDLYTRLSAALGGELAMDLIRALPTDPATKDDIDRLDQRIDRLDQRIDGLDQRIDHLGQRLDDRFEALVHRLVAAFRGELVTAVAGQTRTMMFAVVGAVLATGPATLAVARLV